MSSLGLYQIVAGGAGYVDPGGKGAVVSSLFPLAEGAKLKIAVGQQGASRGPGMTSGGAGGSFVVAADDVMDHLKTTVVLDGDAMELMLAAGEIKF